MHGGPGSCHSVYILVSLYLHTYILVVPADQDDGDYVDIDQHDEYVDPGELMGGGESSAGDSVPPTSPSFDLFKPLPSESDPFFKVHYSVQHKNSTEL